MSEELNKTYNPSEVEDKWYSYWLEHQFFASKPNPDKEPYTILIPPPNVTGVLHMGHMLNNTIQDVLIRRARMQGYEALWVPGTDHASIATEAKVVQMLKERGIDKRSIGREEFLKYAWEWKEKYGGIILDQLKKLGASCDWNRTRFTMDEGLSKQVLKVFVDLYEKGYIYRDYRMGHWDPDGQTALADDEVIHKEATANLYYVKYAIEGEADTFITIATTRPETIMADTAICVNPNDERFQHLVGKKAIIPLINRAIPIIADDYVDMAFGTGCLKVTPAHDPNDYAIGKRHSLEVIDILTPNGKLNERAQIHIGQDRAIARKLVAKDLEAAGLLAKTEQLTHSVGYSERTSAVVEPRLSMQWYVRMEELCKPALDNVLNDNISFFPEKFKNTYRHWMENVRDWCISRQLWWGHRIPVYYLPNGEFVVAETAELALEKAKAKDPSITAEQLKQDEDVLDTWFSSGLWPISVFDGLLDPECEDIKYYYPSTVLVTAPEILFFWVARMIISGYEYRNDKPFKDVYLTGIVRDKLGRKMSKSLGNSPDALELLAKYGADGVRTGMLFCSPAGNDLPFDDKLCEQGRNFSNKIWNAFRLVKGWSIDEQTNGDSNAVAIAWFAAKFQAALAEIEDSFSKYRLSEALMSVYKLVWDDFCAWYLEMVKPAYQQPIDRATYDATIGFFDQLMRLLHPFMPFITEEIWQNLAERKAGESLCVAAYPSLLDANSIEQNVFFKTFSHLSSIKNNKFKSFIDSLWRDSNNHNSSEFSDTLNNSSQDHNQQIRLFIPVANSLEKVDSVFAAITQIRSIRNEKQLSPKVALPLSIKTAEQAMFAPFEGIMAKLANLESIAYTSEKPEGAISFVQKSHEFFVKLNIEINVEEERSSILKEIERMKGFLQSVDVKLSNERFVANAKPDVLERERQKKADAESKIKALEEALSALV